jgi:hypothetical protein
MKSTTLEIKKYISDFCTTNYIKSIPRIEIHNELIVEKDNLN